MYPERTTRFMIWAARGGVEHIKGAFPDGPIHLDGSQTWFIEVDGIDGLLALEKMAGENLLIYGSSEPNEYPSIMIYNDYIE